MRVAPCVLFFSVFANAQSPATTEAFTKVVTACSQASSLSLVSNRVCADQLQVISGNVTNAQLQALCGSSCFGVFVNTYAGLSTCVQGYRPTYIANLKKDNVPDYETYADAQLDVYTLAADSFKFTCLRDERGDYCMPKFHSIPDQLSGTANVSSLCNVYGNLGCCLTEMDAYLRRIAGTSFSDTLSSICPSLVTTPACLSYDQSAVALSVIIPLNGLNCATYAQKDVEFQNNVQAALRNDLVAGGLSASSTVVKSISLVNGVCSATVIVRASSDAATKELTSAASTAATSASLTQTNQALATASDAGANVTLGAAVVSETKVSGQSASGSTSSSNSGSFVTPSLMLMVGVVAMWFA